MQATGIYCVNMPHNLGWQKYLQKLYCLVNLTVTWLNNQINRFQSPIIKLAQIVKCKSLSKTESIHSPYSFPFATRLSYAPQIFLTYPAAIVSVIWEVILTCNDMDMTTLKMRCAKYLQNFKFSFRILSFIHQLYGKNQIKDWILISYSYVTSWHRPQAVG